MTLKALLGQPTAQTTLVRALAADKVHHAYRFEGPAGVGKETAAFLLAQALLCESDAGSEVPALERGCGTCSSCRRVMTLCEEAPHVPKHPDVLLVGRALYPSALIGGASEATGISVAQIRRIVLPRVPHPPHEGRALVVIVREADELTVQAANAMLKTIEEPRRGVHFILLTSRPAQLLDTIRSRTLAVRFGPLPALVMDQLLSQEGISLDVIPLSQGSLARARALSEPAVREAREEFLRSLDEAINSGHPASALTFAEGRPDGRHELLEMLAHAATLFAERAHADGARDLWAKRHEVLSQAILEVERNGSPALVMEAMVHRLAMQ